MGSHVFRLYRRPALTPSESLRLNGGVRRSSDVTKSLALGARGVLIGWPYLWGLAANGQAGVEDVLDILEAVSTQASPRLARASVYDLRPEDLVIPPGFMRRLGS
jgi:isopentenyl diphosphate isomerase/L-lactate dehydrogenase-like FMN-dependent dehydrogenase